LRPDCSHAAIAHVLPALAFLGRAGSFAQRRAARGDQRLHGGGAELHRLPDRIVPSRRRRATAWTSVTGQRRFAAGVDERVDAHDHFAAVDPLDRRRELAAFAGEERDGVAGAEPEHVGSVMRRSGGPARPRRRAPARRRGRPRRVAGRSRRHEIEVVEVGQRPEADARRSRSTSDWRRRWSGKTRRPPLDLISLASAATSAGRVAAMPPARPACRPDRCARVAVARIRPAGERGDAVVLPDPVAPLRPPTGTLRRTCDGVSGMPASTTKASEASRIQAASASSASRMRPGAAGTGATSVST
jgi:hypothetical protein